MRSRILLVSFSLVGLLTLLSCGQDVCVAGIGNCEAYKKSLSKGGEKDLQQGTGLPPSSKLAIGCKSWGQCWTVSESALTLMATGGTPPYSYIVVSGFAGNIPANTSQFSLQTTSMVRTRVRVVDATGNKKDPCDMCEVEVVVIPKQ